MDRFKIKLSRRFLLVLAFVSVAVIAYAKLARTEKDFAQADDFPRDALIYLQIRDLPAALKLWNESELKKNYLESVNYRQFANNHLALKLSARIDEIGGAIGFSPDSAALSGISETKAAIAVYDIGKIEFVFVAPVSEEKILASMFFQNAANFEEITLVDDTKVFSTSAEVDRGRQIQKIFWTIFRGRFVLATSEKYFLQTLDNIKGKTPRNRLGKHPDFQKLAGKTKPNLATVWLNQAKLNADWYFRHYWLMSELEDLKSIRAGMLDFEMRADKFVERRVFLNDNPDRLPAIEPSAARRLIGMIPPEVPFFRIQASNAGDCGDLVTSTLFERENSAEAETGQFKRRTYYFNDWRRSYRNSYLYSDFESEISDQEDETETAADAFQSIQKLNAELANTIAAAKPAASVRLFSPKILSAPMFFDNRKALIFSTARTDSLNRGHLEKTLSELARNFYTVESRETDFIWEDFRAANFAVRKMKMPALGWQIFYAQKGRELIFSNSEELLRDILSGREKPPEIEKSFGEYTEIRLGERKSAFDEIMKTLQTDELKNASPSGVDFFTDNIASLLDVLKEVEKVTINRDRRDNLLFEEIEFVLHRQTDVLKN